MKIENEIKICVYINNAHYVILLFYANARL